MQVVLEIREGYQAGHRQWLNGAGVLRVGRAPTADFPVPEDGVMSGFHFAVELSPEHCLLQDLQSTNGTYHNGQRVVETALSNGDVILAGKTEFAVTLKVKAFSSASCSS